MQSDATLVALPRWEVRLLRALVVAATVAVAVGIVLAIGLDDRDDPALLPAGLCIVLGGAALAGLLLVTPGWTTTIEFDERHVRVTRLLLPTRTLARSDVDSAVLGVVLRPTRYGPEPARRLLLVDATGRLRARATWTPRTERTTAALAALETAGIPVEILPSTSTAHDLEKRHRGATGVVERHPRAVSLVAMAIAAAGLTVALAL